MANRYGYQYQQGMKPKMVNIEGYVSIGTGGLPNSLVAIPSGGSVAGNSGTYWAPMPGCPTPGAPTGWQGTFSGAIGLYGAGVDGIARVGTGLYSIHLSDDFVRLDSVQILPVGGALSEGNGGATGGGFSGCQLGTGVSIDPQVLYHTVGQGNTVATGNMGSSGLVGQNLKNQILVQFTAPSTVTGVVQSAVDLPLGSGFFIALRLRDSLAGPQ